MICGTHRLRNKEYHIVEIFRTNYYIRLSKGTIGMTSYEGISYFKLFEYQVSQVKLVEYPIDYPNYEIMRLFVTHESEIELSNNHFWKSLVVFKDTGSITKWLYKARNHESTLILTSTPFSDKQMDFGPRVLRNIGPECYTNCYVLWWPTKKILAWGKHNVVVQSLFSCLKIFVHKHG